MYFFELFGFPVSLELLLAVVFGFLIGQMRRVARRKVETKNADLRRAGAIIAELDSVASQLRKAVKKHRHSVHQYKDRMATLAMQRGNTYEDLAIETDKVLQPTLKLANDVAAAYEQIKQQSALLLSLTENRTDPLTGVGNHRVLDDSITSMFAMHTRYQTKLSLAVFDIDNFKAFNQSHGHIQGDKVLTGLGALLRENARESDVVTRIGHEKFIMLMPETDLLGGGVLAERVRQAAEDLDITLSAGVATADDCKSAMELIELADTALFESKERGNNLVYQFDGSECQLVTAPEKEVVVESGA
jgi:diguanylate cyclase (GGDEF)-like protein